MITTSAIIHQVSELAGQRAAVLHCQKPIHAEPGQYLALVAEELDSPVPLTPFVLDTDGLSLQVSPIPDDWQPGKVIQVRGSFGHGFHLPPDSSRFVLIGLDAHPNRLLYQLSACHQAGKEILLVCEDFQKLASLPQLPLSVEVLPLSGIPEAVSWAQVIDIDCRLGDFQKLELHKDLLKHKSKDSLVEVLLSTEMPCLGIAECGVCAVHTRKGYQLACKDGPVFRFEEFLL
jgi:NAD(P)H-flavin reductase